LPRSVTAKTRERLASSENGITDDGCSYCGGTGLYKSNIRNAALNKHAEVRGESMLDEQSLMSPEIASQHILNAAVKRKRTLVLTLCVNVLCL
jgi:hypothetical protein